MIQKITREMITTLAGKSLEKSLLRSEAHIIRDNEKPPRKVSVQSFEAQGRPITNEEVSCLALFVVSPDNLLVCSVLGANTSIENSCFLGRKEI